MDKGDVVGNLFQIRCDVGGHQDGMCLILDKIQENIQDIVAHYRIQSAGGFVQDKQLRMVGKGGCNGKLHFHALGKGFDFLVCRQLELFQKAFVGRRIPLAVSGGRDLTHLDGVRVS